MSHAGISKSFWGMFKETSLTFSFGLGGLFAGLMLASQLGVFELSPWVITLYPIVISAKGVGSGFVGLPWVKRQIQQKLGFEPYSGTLNIHLEKKDAETLSRKLKSLPGIEITPKLGFLEAFCFHALIHRKTKGAVIIPKKPEYPPDMVEIIAPISLREEIPVKDGDRIVVTILLQN